VSLKGRPERRSPADNARSRGSFPSRPISPYRRRDKNSFATAQRNYERYVALARAAASSGDIVEMENCYQHAEHYFRVMKAVSTGHE
jgi:hypothetical protein